MIRPANADPANAPDEYTRAMWAASFMTTQYCDDNREVYHLLKDLLTKTEGQTWFEKVKDGDGRAAHLLLREHYVGEAHDMRRAASANAKLESLFWKSETSFPFEKFLTRLNEAFMELEESNMPLYESQKVNYLLKGVKNDDIQVQTTLGIIRDRYLSNFDEACLTLSRTVSSRFTKIEPGRHKRSIGAVSSNTGGRSSGRGRGRGRHGGRGNSQTGRQKVIMNGIDVTDVTRSFTSDEWDKLRSCGGQAYVYQRREYLSGRGGHESRAGGRGGRGGGRTANPGPVNDDRQVAAAAVTTDIVEYDASNTTIGTNSSSSSGRGNQNGGRFGPRREHWLLPPTPPASGRLITVSTIRSDNRHRSVSAIDSKERSSEPGFVAKCETRMQTRAWLDRISELTNLPVSTVTWLRIQVITNQLRTYPLSMLPPPTLMKNLAKQSCFGSTKYCGMVRNYLWA